MCWLRREMADKHDRCKACGRRFKRSNPANARLWLIYHALAERLPVRGQIFSPDTWHEYMKGRYLGKRDILLPNGDRVTIANSTSQLDVAEFNTYMEKVEAWAAEHDVYLDEIFEA